jgi:uncharacterized membrane protein YjjP (DUF1212 family)
MQAIEAALDTAVLIIENGGSTVAANRAFAQVLAGYGKECVTPVWRLDLVVVQVVEGAASATVVRPIAIPGVNLLRASEAMALAERAARGAVAPADFTAALERIKTLPSPHARWLTVVAAACAAAGFAGGMGADWGSLGIVAAAAAVGQALRLRLQAHQVVVALVTLVCGLLSAFIASAGLRLGYSASVSPTLIASVVYLVPGLPLINGFIDVYSFRYVLVGVERMLHAAVLFLLLALAIAFAQTLALSGVVTPW